MFRMVNQARLFRIFNIECGINILMNVLIWWTILIRLTSSLVRINTRIMVTHSRIMT